MSKSYRIYNFVEAKEQEFHKTVYADEPTEAWIEGWEANMVDGYKRNPYQEGTTEWCDYEDGWEEAERN